MTWMLVLMVWTPNGVGLSTVPFPYTEARCYQAAEAFEARTKGDTNLRVLTKLAYCIPSPDAVVR